MSIIGAAETLQVATSLKLGPEGFSMRFFSLIILGILIAMNFIGRALVKRVGNFFIIIVLLSVFSILLGLFSSRSRHESLE